MMRKTYVPPFVLLSGLKVGGGCPEEGEEVIDGGGREKRIDASPLTGEFPILRFAIKLDRGSSNRARAMRAELPDLDVGTSSRRARIDLPRNRSSTIVWKGHKRSLPASSKLNSPRKAYSQAPYFPISWRMGHCAVEVRGRDDIWL
ncbi:hypothetical protein FA13DRAFT_1737581 [Coprinellus micaceus]|uniref:Uncharacterized protein n=1 Tax=Coprinellus micaceus TaxID=71717 RepID=A0A4Y7SX08_COPMI|nr:hypothetical protein FA13DRAFT_1737581 [Coprinellus micaceus]